MNGHFLFDAETRERAPPVEEALRQLPILAKPALTVTAEREVGNVGNKAELAFQDRIYFGVRREVHDDGHEYCVAPLKTLHITGVISYEPSGATRRMRILSAWSDLVAVEFRFRNKGYTFNLCFDSHRNASAF